MRWAKLIACMTQVRNTCNLFKEKSVEKISEIPKNAHNTHTNDISMIVEDIIQMDLNEVINFLVP
jgi:hypothetical protein